MPVCYLDTSAVLKRYLHEPFSAEFESFVVEDDHDFVMSPLVVTELTSALSRRTRNGQVPADYAVWARQHFQDDLLAGNWALLDVPTSIYRQAATLIATLTSPLSTLDALHLACAVESKSHALATADKQLAAAAGQAGLRVFTFF